MLSKLVSVALVASTLLLDVASASRFRDIAHRKGFAPNLKPRVYEQPKEKIEERAAPHRFLTSSTKSKCYGLWYSNWPLLVLILVRIQG
jgi:hypothetical protein